MMRCIAFSTILASIFPEIFHFIFTATQFSARYLTSDDDNERTAMNVKNENESEKRQKGMQSL